jgi:hypothetical protein
MSIRTSIGYLAFLSAFAAAAATPRVARADGACAG